MPKNWRDQFDTRQQTEIAWAQLYTNEVGPDGKPRWKHGANGHNDLVIIGTMATFLDSLTDQPHAVEVQDNVGFVRHVTGCLHCGKDHDVTFHQFKATHVPLDAYLYKYWGMCPTNDEPILMKEDEPK